MKTNIKALLLSALIVTTSVISSFTFSTAVSAKTAAQMNLREQVVSHNYYTALAECFSDGRISRSSVPQSEANDPQRWFRIGSSKEVAVSHLVDAADGRRECQNITTRAFDLWGYSGNYSRALTDMGWRLENGSYVRPSDAEAAFKRTIDQRIYGGRQPSLSNAQLYLLNKESFKIACNVSLISSWDSATSQQKEAANNHRLREFTMTNNTPTAVDNLYHSSPSNGTTMNITLYERLGGGAVTARCSELAARSIQYADAFKAYIAGASTEEQAALSNSNAGTPAAGSETCNLTGVGWLVCPSAILIAQITDGAYALIEKLLVFSFADNALDTDNPVYVIWSNIRNLANIAFIFAFFAIIFSQATSIGIGSYGIKKMLPRLIVAAILVNLSYFICVFAIDVSNIIGAGIDGIIRSVPLSGGGGTSSDPATAAGTWTGIITGLLATGAVAAGVASTGVTAAVAAAGPLGALAIALPFLVTALFAILTALVILIARQAILILLIVVAPLAFVAYILPNTENMFDKWKKIFITMLVFYPLVAILFAGASVAASVLRVTANTGDASDQLVKVMSLAVQIFPLFGLPFILKFSGGLLGRIAGAVNNPNKGPFDRLRKTAEQKRDSTLGRARAEALKRPPADYTGKKFARSRSAVNRAFRKSPFSSTGSAQAAVNRARELDEAKKSQNRAETEYYANRVTSDPAFANRIAGGDQQALGRIRGNAMDALIALNNEEIKTHKQNLNRNGATIAAEGINIQEYIDQSDPAGPRKAYRYYDNTGQEIKLDDVKLRTGLTGVKGEFDAATIDALQYATDNRLTQTSTGARALASTLAATGNLTAETAERLVASPKNLTEIQRATIAEHINAEAGAAGLKHLTYNTVDVNGRFELGGQFGGVIGRELDDNGNVRPYEDRLKEGVVGRIMQNGLSTVTKEMYMDKAFTKEFAAAARLLNSTNPKTFDTELVKMDDRKIIHLVKAQAIEARARNVAFDETATYNSYLKRREDAAREVGHG